MLDEGKHYFLSRPRRFGKSLFLDTCKELFEGSEALFEGLAVHDRWDWSVRHPVVRLSFGAGQLQATGRPASRRDGPALEMRETRRRVSPHATRALRPASPTCWSRCTSAPAGGWRCSSTSTTSPSSMPWTCRKVARANRDYLRGLYAVIKDCDADIRFSFLTGVSKFSKVSLFSGLNNLTDITLDPRYSAICGYTDADLDTVFAPELPGLDRDAIREWYNGYWLAGRGRRSTTPSTSCCCSATASSAPGGSRPARRRSWSRRCSGAGELGGARREMAGTDALLSSFDVDDIATEALLFQTGYLTIREEEESRREDRFYRLGYPNREVRQSLNEACSGTWCATGRAGRRTASGSTTCCSRPTTSRGCGRCFTRSSRASPTSGTPGNDIARYEGLLRERVLLVLRGPRARHHGRGQHQPRAPRHGGAVQRQRVSLRVQGGGDGRRGAAMAQLKARRYADKYRGTGEPIHLVAVEFSRETRNVVAFEVEAG